MTCYVVYKLDISRREPDKTSVELVAICDAEKLAYAFAAERVAKVIRMSMGTYDVDNELEELQKENSVFVNGLYIQRWKDGYTIDTDKSYFGRVYVEEMIISNCAVGNVDKSIKSTDDEYQRILKSYKDLMRMGRRFRWKYDR